MALKYKREVLCWCLYDFANSSYSAVIAAVIFPVFYATQIVGNETGLGDLWWGRAVSLSMAVVSITAPFIGGIADYAGIRKRLLIAYTTLCLAMVACLSFLERGMVLTGFLCVTLANIGMEGALVFYNSFLPVITQREYQGRVSAWGYALGYLGSISSLLLALPLVTAGTFGAAWLMVATFFGVFSVPAFLFLPGDERRDTGIIRAAKEGLGRSWKALKEIWSGRDQRKFLIAYLVYEDGVNTVIVFSSLFAATTLNYSPKELVLLYLIVQCTAFAGAFCSARPIDAWGPKRVVIASLFLWTMVSVAAFFVEEKRLFLIVASVAGLGLGTVQAATRAFFSQFIPRGSESEYFGVYAMVGKTSAILGPLVFGFLSATYGSQRPAILSVAIFFFVGMLILSFVRGGGPNIRASS